MQPLLQRQLQVLLREEKSFNQDFVVVHLGSKVTSIFYAIGEVGGQHWGTSGNHPAPLPVYPLHVKLPTPNNSAHVLQGALSCSTFSHRHVPPWCAKRHYSRSFLPATIRHYNVPDVALPISSHITSGNITSCHSTIWSFLL